MIEIFNIILEKLTFVQIDLVSISLYLPFLKFCHIELDACARERQLDLQPPSNL